MAHVGSAALGQTLIGNGTGASSTFAAIGTKSGLTDNGVVISKGLGAFVATAALANGQLVIGTGIGSAPVIGNIASGTGITVTNGPGTITISLAGGGVAIDSFTPDSGTNPVVPNASGNVSMLGTGSITTVGSLNTLTTQLTGLTQYNVLVGAGTATITKVAPSATTGIPLVSQGSSANPSFSTAVVAGGGTGRTTLTNHGVLVGAATTAITQLAVGATGTVLAGATGADPVFSATPALTSITLSGGTALSQYVEGTYTPVVGAIGTPPTNAYSLQVGRYTRIGNRVIVMCNVVLSSTSGGTGDVSLLMPFTSANPTADANIGSCYLSNVAYTASTSLATDVISNANYALVTMTAPSVAVTVVTVAMLTATSGFITTITYEL